MIAHDKPVDGPAAVNPSIEPNQGVCLLLKDGRLFGPFKSKEDARYWCVSQDLQGFATYDLLRP